MNDTWAVETLKQWHDFYILVGTAGATLLALLFVAVSLGAGFLSNERRNGTRTFMSPVVLHFTSVFFISAICLLPWHQGKILAALIGVTAVTGALLSAQLPLPAVQGVQVDATIDGVEDPYAYVSLQTGDYSRSPALLLLQSSSLRAGTEDDLTLTLTDATTGQPLPGVSVTAVHGSQRHTAGTDRNGKFRLQLPAGTYTMTWQSSDVPAGRSTGVRVHDDTTTFNIKACSTTLDYNCGNAAPGSGG